ncbi:MAG TPA: hypothetical protein VKY54_11350 [Kiloniellales bacterium]|jgi:hypothetical protein|nr:hypothetical protein [Kiloniellales bacterium]
MRLSAAHGKVETSAGWLAEVVVWLRLAAAPTFAVMAWISASGSPAMTLCSAVSAIVPINDMTLMYLLMSLFHAAPWLKLLFALPQGRRTQTEGD